MVKLTLSDLAALSFIDAAMILPQRYPWLELEW
jgi:hypothetical protein